jgi:hypothetical protein
LRVRSWRIEGSAIASCGSHRRRCGGMGVGLSEGVVVPHRRGSAPRGARVRLWRFRLRFRRVPAAGVQADRVDARRRPRSVLASAGVPIEQARAHRRAAFVSLWQTLAVAISARVGSAWRPLPGCCRFVVESQESGALRYRLWAARSFRTPLTSVRRRSARQDGNRCKSVPGLLLAAGRGGRHSRLCVRERARSDVCHVPPHVFSLLAFPITGGGSDAVGVKGGGFPVPDTRGTA